MTNLFYHSRPATQKNLTLSESTTEAPQSMDDQQPPKQKRERTEAQMAALAAARVKAVEVRKQNAELRRAEREVDAAALQAVVKERRERDDRLQRKALIPDESADDEDDEQPEEIIEERIVKKKKRKPKPPVRRRVVVVEESDSEDGEDLPPEEEVTTVSVPRARPPDPLDRVRDRLFGI